MPLIVDVQGFKSLNNQFIVKEFAAYDGVHVCHYVFKPPFAFTSLPTECQKQANWLMSHHHTIDWNAGFTQHYMFPKIIKHVTQNASQVYVKGREKTDFIRKQVNVPVLEFPETPSLKQQLGSCFYHMNKHCICALTNVYYLYNNFVMS